MCPCVHGSICIHVFHTWSRGREAALWMTCVHSAESSLRQWMVSTVWMETEEQVTWYTYSTYTHTLITKSRLFHVIHRWVQPTDHKYVMHHNRSNSTHPQEHTRFKTNPLLQENKKSGELISVLLSLNMDRLEKWIQDISLFCAV